ncbi:unnamed protein product [Owenia fusiformis]|nr:unnamed protein product [Owenia fusiformis]
METELSGDCLEAGGSVSRIWKTMCNVPGECIECYSDDNCMLTTPGYPYLGQRIPKCNLDPNGVKDNNYCGECKDDEKSSQVCIDEYGFTRAICRERQCMECMDDEDCKATTNAFPVCNLNIPHEQNSELKLHMCGECYDDSVKGEDGQYSISDQCIQSVGEERPYCMNRICHSCLEPLHCPNSDKCEYGEHSEFSTETVLMCGDPHIRHSIQTTNSKIPEKLCYEYFGRPGAKYTFLSQNDLKIITEFTQGESQMQKRVSRLDISYGKNLKKKVVIDQEEVHIGTSVIKPWTISRKKLSNGVEISVTPSSVDVFFQNLILAVSKTATGLNLVVKEEYGFPKDAAGIIGIMANKASLELNGENAIIHLAGFGEHVGYDNRKKCWHLRGVSTDIHKYILHNTIIKD